MKISRLCLFSVLLGGVAAHAQTADNLHEGTVLTYDAVSNPTQPYSFKWWGTVSRYYFILQSENLEDWSYFPYAAIGAGGVEGVDFATNANPIFVRIYATSDVNSPPYILDADLDGISNGDELVAGAPYDIFGAEAIVDSDGDGLPDYWEVFYFGDLSRDGTGDYDGDGISDSFEWQARTNPVVDQSATHEADAIGLRRYTYDSVGRVATVSGPVRLTYTFDDEGNLESAQ